MRILELDSGNTRLKWRLLHGQSVIDQVVIDRGFIANSDDFHNKLTELLRLLKPVHRVRIATVSGAERFEVLRQTVETTLDIPLTLIEVKTECHGLKAAYATLGVDRWLATLAAYAGGDEKHQSFVKLVVSCGTAITLDVVTPDGVHQGGFIVPGIMQMKKTLNTSTAWLRLVKEPATEITLGRQSADCINHGVFAMVSAMVNAQQASYPDSVVYLTGGDGLHLKPFIKGLCVYQPELVMDGMTFALD